jgi:hypothetical protein
MPSARSQFDGVRHGSFWLQLLGSSSGSVRVNLPEFNSTAEVTAEVNTSAVTSAFKNTKLQLRTPRAASRSRNRSLGNFKQRDAHARTSNHLGRNWAFIETLIKTFIRTFDNLRSR